MNSDAKAVRELYLLPPAEFTAARNAHVAALTGDAANVIKALRKPTVAAWAVNLLVADGQLAQAVELASALREAQDDLDADELKQLNRQRRALVASLVRCATELVEEHGSSLRASTQDEVAATINAAIVDERAAAAALSGRLVKTFAVADLDATDVAAYVAGDLDLSLQTAPSRDDLADRRARKAAEAAAKAAERAASEAERDLAKIEARLEKARERADLLHERAEELRLQLVRAEEEAHAAQDAVDELEAERKAAASNVKTAAKDAERARAALDE